MPPPRLGLCLPARRSSPQLWQVGCPTLVPVWRWPRLRALPSPSLLEGGSFLFQKSGTALTWAKRVV